MPDDLNAVVPDAPVVETPVAPVVETAPAVEAPVADILAGPDAVPETTVNETAPEAAEAVAETVNAPLPSYDAFQVPETIAVTDPERFAERIGAFDSKLGALESKFGVDHEVASAFRAEALSIAMEEFQRIAVKSQELAANAQAAAEQAITQRQTERVAEWRDQFEKSDLAGNRRETTLARAEGVIKRFAGDEAALRSVLKETGAANNPAVIRLLANIGEAMQEGRSVPAMKATAAPASRAQKLYGS